MSPEGPPTPPWKIVKRDGALVPYDRGRVANAIFKATHAMGRPDQVLADAMARHVEHALTQAYGMEGKPSVEDVQDVVERVLMTEGHTAIARDYIIYRHQRAMARAARRYAFEVTDNVPYKKIYEVLRWNLDHGCDATEGLNRLIAAGRLPELIRAADERFAEETRAAGARIVERLPELRVVIVAGPSSSGKTTTTIKIGETLAAAGVRFRAINIDHYFFDLERHPVDEFGDYDYETPQALDLDLINRHLVDLLEGRAIRTPHYDFKSGRRTLDVHPLSLAPNELLLIDSLHGLYDGMTRGVPVDAKFRVYIETLGQLQCPDGTFMRWADNRLLRRMLRDKQFRNLAPMETLTHWHYVRRSELKHIIPYNRNADTIVNSALPYELPFLKTRLFRLIRAARHRFAADPRRLDAHIRANRVHDLLEKLRGVRDLSLVPERSLLREFMGGSAYVY